VEITSRRAFESQVDSDAASVSRPEKTSDEEYYISVEQGETAAVPQQRSFLAASDSQVSGKNSVAVLCLD
jgi:hypothetical protein